MDVFVVRLNPDTRGCRPYTQYPTFEEYKSIRNSSPMNGFHEAINFKSERGVIRGHLPKGHIKDLRNGKPFALITITAKSASEGGDQIIGIQAGCKYVGEKVRSGPNVIESLNLNWHYTCPESLSLLIDNPVQNARKLILAKKAKTWYRNPTYKLAKANIDSVLVEIEKQLTNQFSRNKFKLITNLIYNEKNSFAEELEVESAFEEDVKKAFVTELIDVRGNKTPTQKEIKSFQYIRDPKVVAYVLKNAKGKCHDCKMDGPFISKLTNLPFLEVHHIQMLKDGGEDTIENAIALCPNCHRKRHYS